MIIHNAERNHIIAILALNIAFRAETDMRWANWRGDHEAYVFANRRARIARRVMNAALARMGAVEVVRPTGKAVK